MIPTPRTDALTQSWERQLNNASQCYDELKMFTRGLERESFMLSVERDRLLEDKRRLKEALELVLAVAWKYQPTEHAHTLAARQLLASLQGEHGGKR